MTAQAGDTLNSKAALRKTLRSRRIALPPASRRFAAQKAARHALRALRKARRIAAYFSHGSELDTAPLLRALLRVRRKICVPKLARSGMRFVVVARQSPLLRNRHGIREPARGMRVPLKRLDAVLLPLLGFDHHGTRLGNGGGHYDRALARPRSFRRPRYFGYAYSIQELERLPRDPWDVRLDAVITDKGVLRCSTG